jgi:hypothetical protein
MVAWLWPALIGHTLWLTMASHVPSCLSASFWREGLHHTLHVILALEYVQEERDSLETRSSPTVPIPSSCLSRYP